MREPRQNPRGRRRGRPSAPHQDDQWRARRGHGEGRGRGRMRRGDVRSALLIALLDGPGHGYELIQLLEEKTGGQWRPSPGSVYPSLQLLQDEGFVTSAERDGKRVYEITDTGRAEAEGRVAASGYPWEAVTRGRERQGDLRAAMRDLHLAAKQVGTAGSPEAVTRAIEVVTDARKLLYRLLAEA